MQIEKKLFIETHGCQMNEYDSAKMAQLLNVKEKLTLTNNINEADVILLNTCSIREKAQDKVYSQLGRYKKLKDKNSNIIIGVGGCVASQEGDAILKRAPFVDIIFGPQTIHRLPELINASKTFNKSQIDISFPEIEKFDKLPTPELNGPSAYVSIMEGCSKYCTFCVVPYTRGAEFSRPVNDILKEIEELTDKGVKEIHLLGQNVNAYRDESLGQLVDFAELLHLVCNNPKVARLRYTTSHPIEFNNAIIEAHKVLKPLVRHLHLPVQSGSDTMLSRMKRNHTVLEYKSKLRALKKAVPEILISSDFIIGFPKETEDEFNKTMKLVEDVDMDFSFSFIYSPRPGTPAAEMEDNVDLEEKKRRLSILQHRLNQQGFEHSRKMVGTTQSILVSDFSKKDPGLLQGRNEWNRVVNFKSNDASLIGEFVNVKIIEALPNSLRGELV